MKKNIFSILFLSALTICIWLWFNRSNPVPEKKSKSQVQQPPQVTNVLNVEPIPTTTSQLPASKATQLERPAGIDDAQWNHYLLVQQIALSQNQPIDFFARVIDQNNQPVAGVELKIELTSIDEEMFRTTSFLHQPIENSIVRESLNLASDSEGWIRLTGKKGYRLEMRDLFKDGYLSRHPDGYFGGISYEATGARNPSLDVLMTNAWNPQKGYTVHLWKKGETENLARVNVGVNMEIENQGQWISNYFVRFVPARVEWTNFDGADLMIRGVRRLGGNENDPYEFTFTLAVPNGGLLVSKDAYPYLAPPAGYRAVWSFESKPENNPPDFSWPKTCYFKLRSGKMYAGVRMGFCDGGFNFTFDGYLNASGSRNLEPDPEKLIADPEVIRRIDEQTRVK